MSNVYGSKKRLRSLTMRTQTAPATPASGELAFYAKTDNKLYKKDSAGFEVLIDRGSNTAINLISTPNESINWTAFNGSTVTQPGSNIGNPLQGITDTYLQFISSSTSAFTQRAFTIPSALANTPLVVSFNTKTTSASFTVEVETSGGFPAPLSVSVINVGSGQFRAFFIPIAGATDYFLRIRNAVAGQDLGFVNVTVGPQSLNNGAAVTDWQAYTPTATVNGVTMTATTGRFRRVGDSAEVQVYFTGTGAGSGATAVLVTIPSGLTIDTTKLPTGSTEQVFHGEANLYRGGASNDKLILSTAYQNTTQVGFVVNDLNSGSSYLTASNWESSSILSAVFSLPIANWSSNVTMADRAVEEYAWNSSATTASDTTSFGNGIGGVQIANFAPTGNNSIVKRVRFQSPIQDTDLPIVEIFLPSRGWQPVSGSSAAYQQNDAATISYGIAGFRHTANNTDYDVLFHSLVDKSGTTWTAFSSGRWRVRKVSSGAAIGGAIGARNVVGDVTGTAVPAGYIGERLTAVNTTANNAFFNTPFSSGTISLTPGTYDLFGMVAVNANGTLTSIARVIVGVRDASATSFSGLALADQRIDALASNGEGGGASVGPWRVNVTTTTTYHAVGQVQAASGTGTLNLRIIANRVA